MADYPKAFGVISVTPLRRLAFFVAADVMLAGLAVVVAALLRFEGNAPPEHTVSVALLALVALVTTVSLQGVLGTYRVSWSFVGLRDIGRVGVVTLGVTAMLLLVGESAFQTGAIDAYSRAAVLIQAPIAFCLLATFRMFKRLQRLVTRPAGNPEAREALIVGAGESAEQVLKSILSDRRAQVRIVGLVDDDPLSHDTSIHGVRVIGGISGLEEHLTASGAKTIIICIASASGSLVRDIVRRARVVGVTDVRIIPPLAEIADGKVSIRTTREVRLDDLLGREAVSIDPADLRGLFAGRTVLVTGAAGTIGSELCRQVARLQPGKLLCLDVDESRLHDLGLELAPLAPGSEIVELLADVRDRQALEDVFATSRIDITIHAAAYKHVPMMEMYPLAALDVNVLGTTTLAEVAEAAGCARFILVSTDKAVEPSSIMGASKRVAELALFSSSRAGSRMIRSAVRFGNVIGSRGSVIPTFERQLAQGGPLTVTHPEMERYFMITSEAVALVLQAATLGEGGDIFVLDMGKRVRILDVARDFIRLHGLEPDRDIPIVFTGMRQGEKLIEILHYPEEKLLATKHRRIQRVHVAPAESGERLLAPVRKVVAARDAEAARELLRARFATLAHEPGREGAPVAKAVEPRTS